MKAFDALTPVSKKLRIALFIAAGLLLAVGTVLLVAYRLSQHVPQFYCQALEIDPAAQRQAAERMDRRAMELASNLQKSGHWQMVFTAEEINGWLAVVLPKKFPQTLPAAMADPRVAIEPGGITLACRYGQGSLQSVLSLKIEPYMASPDVLALGIHKPRAGLLPIPLGDMVANVAKAVKDADLDVQRRQSGGDPVLQIGLRPLHGSNRKSVRIEILQLRQGELYIEGTTEKQK